MLITANTTDKLFAHLRSVHHRFKEASLKVKKEKCLINMPKVEFLGFLVNAAGLRPMPEKLRTIQRVPALKNKNEVQSFLGLINF